MATYGGFNFTNFKGVNLKNTAAIRIEGDGGLSGTLSVRAAQDAARAWTLPDKSGTFGVMGTFDVHLPAITGGNWEETSVVVSGIRLEDALVVTVQDTFNTVTTDRPMAFLAGARPTNGGIHLTFMAPSATATIYNELICAYVVMR